MIRRALLFLILTSGFVSAAAPKARIDGPTKISFGQPLFLETTGTVADKDLDDPEAQMSALVWSIDPTSPSARGSTVTYYNKEYLNSGLLVKGLNPGIHTFELEASGIVTLKLKGKDTQLIKTNTARHVVEVITGDIEPPVVDPPNPVDPPKPPDPPKPTKVESMRVLFLYESEDVASANLVNAFNGNEIRRYLDKHTMEDGGTFAYRFWDKDTPMVRETPGWSEVWTKAKPLTKPVPKVVIFSGTNLVAEETIPDSEAKIIEILKKYGGE